MSNKIYRGTDKDGNTFFTASKLVFEHSNVTPEEVQRPSRDAVKSEWEAYAETVGVDTTDLTKAQIVEAIEKASS